MKEVEEVEGVEVVELANQRLVNLPKAGGLKKRDALRELKSAYGLLKVLKRF